MDSVNCSNNDKFSINPYAVSIGARGVGEIGVVGVTPAIANPVYDATGKKSEISANDVG
jgi:hypothetical protein